MHCRVLVALLRAAVMRQILKPERQASIITVILQFLPQLMKMVMKLFLRYGKIKVS